MSALSNGCAEFGNSEFPIEVALTEVKNDTKLCPSVEQESRARNAILVVLKIQFISVAMRAVFACRWRAAFVDTGGCRERLMDNNKAASN
ncbi:hypothetical protein T10_13192 [Trichinella papuae]|uniref:Uncharacterized protein n=1 Tax=Trichinella papuae TaxID=268474 RepID=A0A0V1MED1_9BILA|nr:hypothetical protein T10_13192 [Trichinella papuae]